MPAINPQPSIPCPRTLVCGWKSFHCLRMGVSVSELFTVARGAQWRPVIPSIPVGYAYGEVLGGSWVSVSLTTPLHVELAL